VIELEEGRDKPTIIVGYLTGQLERKLTRIYIALKPIN
jgi:hypothetical protein